MDMVKVRLQLTGEGVQGKAGSPFGMAKSILKNEGELCLFSICLIPV
jgi:hypothetical protein